METGCRFLSCCHRAVTVSVRTDPSQRRRVRRRICMSAAAAHPDYASCLSRAASERHRLHKRHDRALLLASNCVYGWVWVWVSAAIFPGVQRSAILSGELLLITYYLNVSLSG